MPELKKRPCTNPLRLSLSKSLASSGAAEGLVVVADFQEKGRGRQGREWFAPPGSSLLLSLLFRPHLAPDSLQQLTMLCGLSIVDAIREVTGRSAKLKWPNDVLLEGAKVGGILTEVVLREQCVDSVIVGIGLNVNLRPDDVPRPLLVDATSLSQVVGRRVSRWQLLGEVLSSVRKRYLALGRGVSPLAEWAEGLAYIGELVSVCEAGVFFEGIAEAVDADGALRIVQADGRRRRVLAGDVTVRLARQV